MRFLMRAAIDPLDNMNQTKYIVENHTGGNIGNMLFVNSIVRTLLVDDTTTIDCINIARARINDAYIDYVNSHYDYFLIPLANAFKNKFYRELVKLTSFVNSLSIPCCILCVGIQTLKDADFFSNHFPYNKEAKALLCAVLKKSPLIGVRGEATSDYLKYLGFLPETDFTVIGCPSMYTYGPFLPQYKNTVLNEDSVVAFNSKSDYENQKAYRRFVDFSHTNMERFPHSIYVQQEIHDVQMMYLDGLNEELKAGKFYDLKRAVSFTNVPSWLDYLEKNVDFSFGTRIHGNVAAILAGIPSVVAPYDQRVQELADYHQIPQVPFRSLTDQKTLYEIFNEADFSSIYRGHAERFEHYLAFLKKLGLDTIYDHEYKDCPPYDKIVQSTNYYGVVRPYSVIGGKEKFVRRWEYNCLTAEKARKYFRKKVKKSQKKVKKKIRKIARRMRRSP